uniref:Uncharacterized protein n=1 Tax=Caenorhabditis japonica TaxID=281687 RepID=A0A8R1E1G3_CAEJA
MHFSLFVVAALLFVGTFAMPEHVQQNSLLHPKNLGWKAPEGHRERRYGGWGGGYPGGFYGYPGGYGGYGGYGGSYGSSSWGSYSSTRSGGFSSYSSGFYGR